MSFGGLALWLERLSLNVSWHLVFYIRFLWLKILTWFCFGLHLRSMWVFRHMALSFNFFVKSLYFRELLHVMVHLIVCRWVKSLHASAFRRYRASWFFNICCFLSSFRMYTPLALCCVPRYKWILILAVFIQWTFQYVLWTTKGVSLFILDDLVSRSLWIYSVYENSLLVKKIEAFGWV